MKVLKVLGKIFGGLLAFVCSVVVFFVTFAYVTVLISEQLVSKNNINRMIEEADVLSLPANEIISNVKENITIKDYLLEVASKNNISENLVNTVLDSVDYEEIIADYASSYASHILRDTEKPMLDSKLLTDAFDKNKSTIEKEFKKEFTDEEVAAIYSSIDDAVDEINEAVPDIKETETDLPMNYINFLYSGSAKLLFAGFIVLIMLLIGLFRFNLYSPFSWTGVPLIIIGIVFSIAGFMKSPIENLINADSALITKLIEVVGDNIFSVLLTVGLIILALGIIFIVISALIKKKFKKNKFPDEPVFE